MDRLVVARGLVPTREKARRLILAGDVLVDEVPVDKPGTLVREDASIRLRRPPKPYVGRGGEKLEGALDGFGLDPKGLHVVDVGASTGGFTDCVLKRGAAAVTAVDVGKGQLDWKLYSDPRVRVVEEVNARYLRPEDFPERFDLALLDLSFISLSKILPAVAPLVKPLGYLLMLVKPQFELGPEAVERGGLVRDPRRHLEALESAFAAARAAGLTVLGALPSPITGASGNQEYFLLARRGGEGGLEGSAWTRAAREACGLEDS